MTVYRKCRPCKHRGACMIQEKIATAIKGLGVGSISHRCGKFEAIFQRGDNLWVATLDQPHDEYGGNVLAVFPAVFISLSKTLGRAIVFIEPGAKDRDGEYEFQPIPGKEGFCSVSYAPYRGLKWSSSKGIVDVREGRTPLRDCCDKPFGVKCSNCQLSPDEDAGKFLEWAP